MNANDIEEMRKVFLSMAADYELGKVNPELLKVADSNIKMLNDIVDNNEMPTENLSSVQKVINLCYQYYRFREIYLSNS